jgi:hypothetical protein
VVDVCGRFCGTETNEAFNDEQNKAEVGQIRAENGRFIPNSDWVCKKLSLLVACEVAATSIPGRT